MNEYSILLYLLTKTDSNPNSPQLVIIGATEEEISKKFHLNLQTEREKLLCLLNEFSTAIQPFGLEIRQNIINHHWFLAQDIATQRFFNSNPFNNKPRLAATLCAIITLNFSQKGPISEQELQKLRKKGNLRQDLDELEDLGFIEIVESKIALTPNLAYYLDFDSFFQLLEREIQTVKETHVE